MKSIKAILAGSLFIIIIILVIQLAIIFLMVGYNHLATSLPLLHEIRIYFRYIVAYPLFFVVLFIGGYLTAVISQTRVLLHCFLVGFITIGISMSSAVEYMDVTLTGMLMIFLALLAVMAGGLYWQRSQNGAV